MARMTPRLHHGLRQRVLLGENIVDQEVRGIDLLGLVVGSSSGGGRWCGLDAFAEEEVLEGALGGAEAVDGPAGEEAGVVLGDLLGGCMWLGFGGGGGGIGWWGCVPGETFCWWDWVWWVWDVWGIEMEMEQRGSVMG